MGLPLPSQLVHIDIDPAEIGHNYPAKVGIAADARLALEALLTELSHYPINATSRTGASTRHAVVGGRSFPLVDKDVRI